MLSARILWGRVCCASQLTGQFAKKVVGQPVCMAHTESTRTEENTLKLFGKEYPKDSITNITPRIINLCERRLHLQPYHPLALIKARIVDHFYAKYRGSRGNPMFSVHENLNPVVTLKQNFDQLLVPEDHPARKKSDSYYINGNLMLRAHTSAHQHELIAMGLNNFLVVGDVYRRDEIDSSHYPVFHQMEGVRLLDEQELNEIYNKGGKAGSIRIHDSSGNRTEDKQERHCMDVAKLLEIDLKSCLLDVAKVLFGDEIEYRWVSAYFPFTHPSWELEIFFRGKWLEVLGCGIMEQMLLDSAGAKDKIGWAFGLGLERLAMRLYEIPDIRVFWSKDTGVLNQFKDKSPNDRIVYKTVSKHPQCINDISFWIPNEEFCPNDFYDLVGSVGGEIVEQVELFDSFHHPKKDRHSHAYRIVYRSLERTLSQQEVNDVHKAIEEQAVKQFNVEIR